MAKEDKEPEVILASRSPRRRELMARVTPEFRAVAVDVDEASVAHKDPVKFAVGAAILKAKTAAESFPRAIVIGADTVVALHHTILGKPADRASAREMLRSLSGRRHRVITGLALFRKDEARLLTASEITYVTFRSLTDDMVEAYLNQEDYLDKAGAYAVQDIGDAFVRRLRGDYDNVVGFPVKRVAQLLARMRAPSLHVTVEDIDFPESAGKGTAGGRTLLIPGAVTGDTLRVQVVGESRGEFIGDIIRVENPSPLRVPPACRHFGTCGGCLFQNVAYPKQLELKRRHLARLLRDAGIVQPDTPEIRPVMPSPQVYGYRNKMEFGFGESWGEVVLGLRERGLAFQKSLRRTVGLEECPIFGPSVATVFPAVLEFVRGKGLAVHNPATGRGALRHLVLRDGKQTGDLMVLLVTAAGCDLDAGPLAESLAGANPRLKSFYHVTNSRVADIVSCEETRLLAGAPWIEERIGGATFRIGPETFFQTNTEAAELLYREIGRHVGPSAESRVLGLYCGSGAIEISIARHVREVVGIDSAAENIRAAEVNAAANGVANAKFFAGTVESYLKGLPPAWADIVIVDPPRPGLTPEAKKNILGLNAPAVVYVSCNPEALAKDLTGFLARGYRVEAIAPFDFFPHTPHLEILAVLRK